MSKNLHILALVLFMICGSFPSKAQHIFNASNELLHVQEAMTPKSGNLTLYSHMDVNTVSSPLDDYNIWIVRNTVHIDYSIFDNLLLGLNTSIYQDIHRKDPSNNFDHLIFTVKTGSFGFGNDHFFVGALGSYMLPFSDYNNNYGLPYTAGGNEIGFDFIFSFYTDNLFPKESTSISLNIGYYNYFDKDEDISHNSREFLVTNNSSAFKYSFGLLVPTPSLDIIIEMWGHSFIQQPPTIAYSREDQLFLTFATKLNPISFINLNIGGDLLLSGNDEETDFNLSKRYGIRPIPQVNSVNYPEWRFFLGLEFNILPFNLVADASIFSERKLSKFEANRILKKLNEHKANKEWSNKEIDKLNKNQLELEKNVQLLRSILRQE